LFDLKLWLLIRGSLVRAQQEEHWKWSTYVTRCRCFFHYLHTICIQNRTKTLKWVRKWRQTSGSLASAAGPWFWVCCVRLGGRSSPFWDSSVDRDCSLFDTCCAKICRLASWATVPKWTNVYQNTHFKGVENQNLSTFSTFHCAICCTSTQVVRRHRASFWP